MPPWSRPLEVERLADGAADVDFVVPLAELPGLRTQRAAVTGSVSGRVHFARRQGKPVAELSMNGTAVLECQRCMQPLRLAVNVDARIALVGSDSQAEELPADLEPVLAAGGRISIGELVTEELLLTLPIVPLHEPGVACRAPPPPGAAAAGTDAETHRPFERLAELMKR